jgi:hypothetical protein
MNISAFFLKNINIWVQVYGRIRMQVAEVHAHYA